MLKLIWVNKLPNRIHVLLKMQIKPTPVVIIIIRDELQYAYLYFGLKMRRGNDSFICTLETPCTHHD